MKISEARQQFVQTWGSLGGAWGIPKSMAQIHALLLTTNAPMSTEEIMEITQLSRGNVSINLRELINWKLIAKQNILGERKEYYGANHDVWNVAQNIVQQRRNRELEPVLAFLNSIKSTELEGNADEVAHFRQLVSDLHELLTQLERVAELLVKINQSTLYKRLLYMLN